MHYALQPAIVYAAAEDTQKAWVKRLCLEVTSPINEPTSSSPSISSMIRSEITTCKCLALEIRSMRFGALVPSLAHPSGYFNTQSGHAPQRYCSQF